MTAKERFIPIIAAGTNLQTCVQVTTATASANVELDGEEVLIKCLTQPSYIRLGPPGVTVTTSNGYYMAVGDEVRWQKSRGANTLAYIRATGTDGALSIAPGLAE